VIDVVGPQLQFGVALLMTEQNDPLGQSALVTHCATAGQPAVTLTH
jgi:hypothetical protein